MRLENIIVRSRVVDLRSVDLEGALQELVAVSAGKFPDLKKETLLKGLMARESTMTTYLGMGVALPHLRVHACVCRRGAAGRCRGARREPARRAARLRLRRPLRVHRAAGLLGPPPAAGWP